MSAKIQLTPAELINQATQMQSLQQQMDSLFSNITNDLNTINESWSTNLAHNFSAKILNTQKCFTNIVEMLGQGSNIARESALTFESVDSLLSRAIIGVSGISGGGTLDGILPTQETIEQYILSFVDDDVKDIYEAIERISQNPEQIPEELKSALKGYLNEVGLGEAVSTAEDMETALKAIASGDADALKDLVMEKAIPYIKDLGDGSLNDNIVVGTTINALDNFYNGAKIYIQDPSKKNAVSFLWNVSGGAMGEALVDNAYNFLSKVPVFGEYMENVLSEYGGGIEGLSNLTNETMGKIMGDDWVNYYNENGGYFNGVYNGVAEIVNYVKEEGASAFVDVAKGTVDGFAEFATGSVDYVMTVVNEVKSFAEDFGTAKTVEVLAAPYVEAFEEYIVKNSKSFLNNIFG